jgi:hypothetical protein
MPKRITVLQGYMENSYFSSSNTVFFFLGTSLNIKIKKTSKYYFILKEIPHMKHISHRRDAAIIYTVPLSPVHKTSL